MRFWWFVNTMLALLAGMLNLGAGKFDVALPWGVAALYAFVIYINEEGK